MEDLWKALANICENRHNSYGPLLLATDRDGTLVPYEDNPENAVMPRRVREQLEWLAMLSHVTVATVSARPVRSLVEDFGENAIIMAGNYGLEISYPDGSWDIQSSALQARPHLVGVRDELAARLQPEWNVILEDHRFSLCAHWHMTPQEFLPKVHSLVLNVMSKSSGIKLVPRPTSYEFFPPVEWDKSHALDRIRENIGTNFIPVYFGDSEADECAFDWVNRHNGVSVKVGNDGFDSTARFRVETPEKLHELLERLVTLLAQQTAAAPGARLR